MILDSEQIIRIDQELCTGCGRCKDVCPVDAISGERHQPHTIDVAACILCGQCVQECSAYDSILDEFETTKEERLAQRGMLPSVKEPLFAAHYRGDAQRVFDALKSDSYTMVQCAPAVRVAIGEEFGLPLGSLTPGKLAAALRRLGFDRVYDTNFAADLTIMEEGSELIQRVREGGTLPMFTSCCPGWVKYMEDAYPELVDHLSSCKSPMQMAGTMFKTYGARVDDVDPAKVFSVAIMPCTCKKFESERPEMQASGYRDVDVVLTTRELAQMLRHIGVDFTNLPSEDFDKPLGTYSGAGNIFGNTGGVMEAALRTGVELLTGQPLADTDLEYVRGEEGIRTATVECGATELKVAIVAGLENVVPILEDVKNGVAEYHFIEVMCCPQGCVSGGGQPKMMLPEHREKANLRRKAGLYAHDRKLEHRRSHENPDIKRLYEEFLGEPLGHESHHLLHTDHRRNGRA